jgi:hypothetical protein
VAVTGQETVEEAAAQLAAAIRWPVERRAMYALVDLDPWRRDPEVFARQTVAELTSDDPRAAAEAARTVLELVVGADEHGGPDGPSEGWWTTPLGRLAARTWSAQDDAAGVMGVQDAADMLGLSRWRIYQLVDEGRLERGPGRGEILRASVGRELAAREAQ